VSETADEAIGRTDRRRWRGSVIGLTLLVLAGVLVAWLQPLYAGPGLCPLGCFVDSDGGPCINCCMHGWYWESIDRYPDWVVNRSIGSVPSEIPTRNAVEAVCPVND
jgi:hypothetical protein